MLGGAVSCSRDDDDEAAAAEGGFFSGDFDLRGDRVGAGAGSRAGAFRQGGAVVMTGEDECWRGTNGVACLLRVDGAGSKDDGCEGSCDCC